MDQFDSIAVLQTAAQLDFVLCGDRVIRRRLDLGMKPAVIVMLPGARKAYEGFSRMDYIPAYADSPSEAAQTIETLLGQNSAHIGSVHNHVVALRSSLDDPLTSELESLSNRIKVVTLRTPVKLRA